MTPLIRRLDPIRDLDAVAALYDAAGDYWLLADRVPHGPEKAAEFFTDAPPGCDPAASFRMGMFDGDRLQGVAELSFGFPAPGDAYLGLMILSAPVRGAGFGRQFLTHLEGLARGRGSVRIFLGVLVENPRGAAFWRREGFAETGVFRDDTETGHRMLRLVKDLVPLRNA